TVRSLGVAGTIIPDVASEDFQYALSALTNTTLDVGHELELLQDGPNTLTRIEADVREARYLVAVQNYFCEPGKVTDWLKTLLMRKAREGVKVMFLRDGFGCRRLSDAYLDSLRSVGIEIATVRPIKWYSMHSALHRSHVRSVILDHRVAFTGGFGFADKWLDGEGVPGWRETTVRFTGPAVVQLAGAFAAGWTDATGQLVVSTGLFPPIEVDGRGAMAGVMFTTRTYGTPVPERYLAMSIAGARKTLFIANPYFIPNTYLRKWLISAAMRGVDGRILTASENVDVKFTHWAARSTYRELLEGG